MTPHPGLSFSTMNANHTGNDGGHRTRQKPPELLLDELSDSLRGFQSTVNAWLPPTATASAGLGPKVFKSGDSSSASFAFEPRQPRLGLGAKPQASPHGSAMNDQKMAALSPGIRMTSAGVFGDMALKNQLTRTKFVGGRSDAKASERIVPGRNAGRDAASKPAAVQKKTARDRSRDDEGGRASSIGRKAAK